MTRESWESAWKLWALRELLAASRINEKKLVSFCFSNSTQVSYFPANTDLVVLNQEKASFLFSQQTVADC